MPTTPTLADYDGNRENNFTAIRLFLAWLVLWGHSFAIVAEPGLRDPLIKLFQGSIWSGELAVNGFFAISGFLVTASICKRSVTDYFVSRVLRIYPALAVCVALTVFVMGPLFTTLGLGEYFSHPRTWQYLSNMLALPQVQWTLPGVFTDSVRPSANGSLWTLTVEVRCYLLLALAGTLHVLKFRALANFLTGCLLLFGLFHYADLPLVGEVEKWSRPTGYFLVGVFFYINRNYIVLDSRLAVLSAGVLFAAFGESWFDYAAPFTFAYLLFFTAYRTPFANIDARFGDMSYGIYIYAWPVQKMVATLLPGIGPYAHIAVSTVITVACARASWQFIEAPALAQKRRLMGKLSRPVARPAPASTAD